ncbi:hypothetical protein AVEN_46421-1 [Araneus ventricosus]|uniref:Uncharacterized protein n=1 Tax=Araneus ventricosus TaxID=182803 RepID=A0A4Y2V147_ARAVE|nr:hypothetical protein AVEN_46421-1 [Araneus ventricosus]
MNPSPSTYFLAMLLTVVSASVDREVKRSFSDLGCMGVYDKAKFTRLDRVCEECYQLYREPEVHTSCSTSLAIFGTPFSFPIITISTTEAHSYHGFYYHYPKYHSRLCGVCVSDRVHRHQNTRYCPTATRKTLSRDSSNRRVEEGRETSIQSTATFGKLSAVRQARNSFSTETQSEMRLPPVLPAPNEIKPFPSPPKCSGISRFRNDSHLHVWCLGFFLWR